MPEHDDLTIFVSQTFLPIKVLLCINIVRCSPSWKPCVVSTWPRLAPWQYELTEKLRSHYSVRCAYLINGTAHIM